MNGFFLRNIILILNRPTLPEKIKAAYLSCSVLTCIPNPVHVMLESLIAINFVTNENAASIAKEIILPIPFHVWIDPKNKDSSS